MNHKHAFIVLITLLLLAVHVTIVSAQGPTGGRRAPATALGTAFTYQGQLKQSGNTVNGNCDAQFGLWDAASAGAQIGITQTQVIAVTNGLFTTQIDFGGGAFNGEARWLAISVRCPSGSGNYTALSPRQPLTPAPYALYSAAPWVTNGTSIYYNTGNVGIGPTLTAPGERLHIGDGNVLLEGGAQTAIKIKRDVTYTGGPSGTSQNPIFELGRIIQAGDKDPEIRFMYSDDNTAERSVLEFDRKGIVASVKPDVGSHFEGFVCPDPTIPCPDSQPRFRLNSHPSMTLEMGPGGNTPPDVAVRRETTNTLILITGTTEKLRIDTNGNVGIGTSSPQSTLQVTGNYIQFPTISGIPPPASDCNSSAHYGRVVVRTDGTTNLYVCTASGWIGK